MPWIAKLVRPSSLLCLLLMTVIFGVVATSDTVVWAQDAETNPAPPAADASGKAAPAHSDSWLWWLIETSGLIGLFLLIISIYFVAKVTQLFMTMKPDVVAPPDLVQECEALLAKRDYNGIYQLTKENDSEYGQLVSAGLVAMSSGVEVARETVDRTGEAIGVDMEKQISMLAVIGSLGPMIGLLGTLKGMIASFSVIARSDQALKPSEVAGGISEALVLTFEGVFLSVPAIYFFAFFKGRASTLVVDVINRAESFIRRVHTSAQKPATGSAPAATK